MSEILKIATVPCDGDRGWWSINTMHDSRLIGTWRSDAPRTWRELSARRDIPAASRRALRRLFGRLELRYTRTLCYSTLDGETEAVRYTVVAKDASSVAIVTDDPLIGRTISHIRFEDSHLWIAVGSGLFREFFKRVQSRERPGLPANTRSAKRLAHSKRRADRPLSAA